MLMATAETIILILWLTAKIKTCSKIKYWSINRNYLSTIQKSLILTQSSKEVKGFGRFSSGWG